MFYLALAIFTRSPAAYEALKSFKILQLPSRSTLQSYTGTFLHEPGVSNQCIADQVARYVMFKAECEKQGNSTFLFCHTSLTINILTRETQAAE